MGSNMAEAHPVGFQWVLEARERGAEIIHVDPRFSRTSAMASRFVPLRAGSDIAFLGGIVSYILEHGRDFREYVLAYTNAATIVSEEFRDTEDLDGLFSGWDPEAKTYDPSTWQYAGMTAQVSAGQGEATHAERAGSHGAPLDRGEPPERDETLQHPRCVYQILKRHFSRYTPELVERACGVPAADFEAVAEALCRNSGRDRTSAFCYAVGWTQHTVGVQYIRTAAIIQLLLGNIGRPGGGIMALRGHASIQGSTDIPTLFNLLPGYLPMPAAEPGGTLETYVEANSSPTGYWGHMDAYATSLMRAWFGPPAAAENGWGFDWLPRITGDHSIYPTMMRMLDGEVPGMIVVGQNPAVGSSNSRLHRLAMAKLEWLVVRDLVEVESASFWYEGREIESGELRTEEIATEVFFLPAAAHTEKDGSFTNTQRLLQWHHKAVEPTGDVRSDLWFYYHLGLRIRERLADSAEERDRPVQALTWQYATEGETEDPSAGDVLREINGVGSDGRALSTFNDLRPDGSTSCGCWIYCGVHAGEQNQAARRKPGREQTWVAPEWGWAWPANRRILYNRASADPDGHPWSEAKRYVWWDGEARKWTGEDVPDFVPTMAPDYVPEDGAEAEWALAGSEPFIMQTDGVGWLYAPSGLKDGPLPAHYEPEQSPVANPLYSQRANPARQRYDRRENRTNPNAGDAYPHVVTTYRLTEHHTAGGMSRGLPYLAELQPEMFCEVDPELARLEGLENGGWATVSTANSEIEARVLVTDRLRPLVIDGKTRHQVGLPWHWGTRGLATGDSANDLLAIVLDPNVHIMEAKASTCAIRRGRRRRRDR
jgi:formate dehydrogenase major subunit